MLRAFLLASPLALALVSCGDSATSFDNSTLPGGTSAAGASGGNGAGATSSVGGSSSMAGKNSGAGTGNGSAGTSAGQAGSNNGGASSGGSAGSNNDAGTNNSAGNDNGGGSGGSGQAGNAGTGQAGSAGNEQGGSGGAPAAGNAGNGGSDTAGNGGTGGSPGPTCLDVLGDYEVKNTDGACMGVSQNASQSIQATDEACVVHFESVGFGPAGAMAVNGNATLDANGNFSGAALTLGKMLRAPCSGKWDMGQERMIVKCGLGPDVCSVVMDRK